MKKVLTKSVGVLLILLILITSFVGCVNPEVDGGEQAKDENNQSNNVGGESGDGETNQGDESTDNNIGEGNENTDKNPDDNNIGEENGNGDGTEHTHIYEWVTDIEPTYTTPGVKHKECDCGDKTEDNTVAERLIHSDELTDGAIDPSMYTHEIFNSFSELNDFCSGNKEKLGGAFVCLDLLSAKDDGISVQTQYAPPPYAFDYEEEKDDKYINSKLITYYELYIKELGTDTDINEDVPYHSITLELISTVSQQLEGNITYEFFRYNDSKTMWNYVVRIYSDNRCIAEMYYYIGLDINREWIASFLDEYIITMD